MTKEDVIRMAREAGGEDWGIFRDFMPELERFAELVAEAERERIRWDSIHSCHPECDKPVCVAMRKAVAEEREACANLVEQAGVDGYGTLVAALLIRERGAP